MTPPKLKEVELRNVHGIRYLKMRFGQVTRIVGSNGTGKTSIIDGIRRTAQGGYDPSWVRDPEAPGAGNIIIGEPPVEKKAWPSTKAKSTITMTDGSYIVRIVDREQKTSEVTYYSASGEELGKQTLLKSLMAVAAFDPLAFLRADTKDRQKILMKFLRADITEEEILEAVGDNWYEPHFKPEDGAFPNLDRIQTAAEERRRKAGRERDEVEKTINNLSGSVPTINEDSAELAKVEVEAGKDLARLTQDRAATIAEVSAASLQEKQKVWSETDAETSAVDTWLRQQIDLLKQQAETKKAEILKQRYEKIGKIEKLVEQENESIRGEYDPQIDAAKEAHLEAKERLQAYNRADGLRAHIAKERKRYGDLVAIHNQLDTAVERIRALRQEKLKGVPIEGLAMVGGEVYYDGLPLDGGINQAKMTQLAVEIAGLSTRADAIPFMILDEAEGLDPKTVDDFLAALVGAGFQVVYAQVDQTRDEKGKPVHVPLKVSTQGELL